MVVERWDPFPPAALEANRAGSLTDTQQRHLLGVSRSIRSTTLGNAGVIVVAAAVSLVGLARLGRVKQWSSVPELLLAGVVLAIATFVIARTLAGSTSLARDLRQVDMQSTDGAIGKRLGRYSASRTGRRPRYLDVGDQSFRVPRDVYEAAPDAGFVRVYFLRHSRRIVNLERLPDRPLALDAPVATLARSLLDEARSGRRGPINEIRAAVAVFQQQPAAPSQGDRDPRPLGEAILGTWSSGFMTVTFSPDGTVKATMLGGLERRGHWSVDGRGRLRADVTGTEGAAEAWVVGDELTISIEGEGLTLRREPGA